MSDNPWESPRDYWFASGVVGCVLRSDKPGQALITLAAPDTMLVTQTIDGIIYSTTPYVAPPRLSRQQRIIRWFTPRRWRKPLPQPSGGVPIVTIKTTGA